MHVSIQTVEGLYREIELMRQLKHPNIVRYLGAELNEVLL
jgi:serine/threonine protein kinase